MSSPSPHDEEVLNVFREAGADTSLETGTVVSRLPIGQRAVQKRLNALESAGRLELVIDGQPKVWCLADGEPAAPIRHPKVATAVRWANQAGALASRFAFAGIAALGAAGFVLSYHVLGATGSMSLPLFEDTSVAVIGTAVGIIGSVLLGLSFAGQFVAVILPWVVKRRVDDRLGLHQ